MNEPTTDQQERWVLFHTAVMKLAKEVGFDGCVVAAFSLVSGEGFRGGRLFSATASDPSVEREVVDVIHSALAQRLVGLTPEDLDGHRPIAEA